MSVRKVSSRPRFTTSPHPTPDLPPLIVMIVTPGKAPRYIDLPDPRVAFIREYNALAPDVSLESYARLDPIDQSREDERLKRAAEFAGLTELEAIDQIEKRLDDRLRVTASERKRLGMKPTKGK